MKVSAVLRNLIILLGGVFLPLTYVSADNYGRAPLAKPLEKFFPKSYVGSFFEEKFSEAIEVKDEESSSNKNQEQHTLDESVSRNKKPNIEFQTSDVSKKTFLPPDQTPSVAINPNAPSSIISMIESNRRGDSQNAKAYARQFVRVLQNFFFEARQITSLIGDALIEENAIQEEEWVGAEQAIDIELAKTRLEKGVTIKPSHDVAMKRIVPDPKKEVEVYYIFARTCSYCRFMAPDVERLYRALQGDKRVKFTGLVVGDDVTPEWLEEFKTYTGMTLPVFDGSDFSKKLKLRFFPVLLVVSPNGQRSYFKSGQQSFERMYEFVRVAQGLAVDDTPALQAIIRTPIGEGEKLILASDNNHASLVSGTRNVRMPSRVQKKIQVEKF